MFFPMQSACYFATHSHKNRWQGLAYTTSPDLRVHTAWVFGMKLQSKHQPIEGRYFG